MTDTTPDGLDALFNRPSQPPPDSNDLEVLFGGKPTPKYREGQRVRLLCDLEELQHGMFGVVRLAANTGASDDGVEFEIADGGVSIRRMVNGRTVRVIDYVEPIQRPAELPEPLQGAIGYMQFIISSIESQRTADMLNDAQQALVKMAAALADMEDQMADMDERLVALNFGVEEDEEEEWLGDEDEEEEGDPDVRSCPDCDGTGLVDYTTTKNTLCDRCNGSGSLDTDVDDADEDDEPLPWEERNESEAAS